MLGGRRLVLRYGYFYGPGSSISAHGSLAAEVAKRRLPIVGGGSGVWSFIHVEDAARPRSRRSRAGEPASYNVVDDEPARVREWIPALAQRARREAAAQRPGVARTPARGRVRRVHDDARAGRLQRTREGRARLDTALRELARGLPHGARLSRSARYFAASQFCPTPTSTPSGGSCSHTPHISRSISALAASGSAGGPSNSSSSWIVSSSRVCSPDSASARACAPSRA